MEIYDYRAQLTKDILAYLCNRDVSKTSADNLYNELLLDDTVTGLRSNSYTLNALQAEQNLVGNYDLLRLAIHKYKPTFNFIKQGPEAADVLIRCYLLQDTLDKILDNNPDILPFN